MIPTTAEGRNHAARVISREVEVDEASSLVDVLFGLVAEPRRPRALNLEHVLECRQLSFDERHELRHRGE